MTTPYIGNPPPEYLIPATLGADSSFSVAVTDTHSNPIDLVAAVIQIEIAKGDTPQTVNASITTNTAAFDIPASLCDQTTNSTRWQITITVLGSTIPVAVAVGKFQRYDG